TAETVIAALEDAEDYKAFEAVIIADYDAQSAVERELVLRLASLLWRLRRATTIETGLFAIQADHLHEFRETRGTGPDDKIVHAIFGERAVGCDPEHKSGADTAFDPTRVSPAADLACCFLRLANLPNYALDRLSRYEATLWRQVGQTLFALDALARRKSQERGHRHQLSTRLQMPIHGVDD